MATPHFLGIGAQKAGTSWLYRWLATHPALSFPLGKEAHYWDRQPDADGAAWRAGLAAGPTDRLSGEITPAYATLAAAAVGRIASLCPDLRIFYILRNPIERDWAQARMIFARKGLSLADDDKIAAFLRTPQCTSRSAYGATLVRWRAAFGTEPVHVMIHDDMIAAPRRLLASLAAHLAIDDRGFDLPADRLREKVFEGEARPMPQQLTEWLRRRYRASILRLGDELGRDLSHWLGDASGGRR